MKNSILNIDKKNRLIKIINSIFTFYRDGFKGMVLGKKLWTIILIKLFVMFAVLKLLFFPNYLNTKFETDEEKGNYVLEQITRHVSKGQSK
ncbi:MAG: DUF4492 domain-containing protein [Deltaproteobacteria bacterium]|uniref:DUF4492 domain-containing protein n=1 Tax=Desulfobacula sp. TaxID=2593537 RepID=UPI0019A0B24B|nr:DUF4492 domain-containing protein [Candidatus Desulfobacula maris]MBL6994350.1 DUF4492 domain-containing protein [Desulfobacula sp.]